MFGIFIMHSQVIATFSQVQSGYVYCDVLRSDHALDSLHLRRARSPNHVLLQLVSTASLAI